MNEVLSLFVGVGLMLVLMAFAYLFAQFGRSFKMINDVDARYAIIEMAMLKKLAEDKKIDIDKELAMTQQFKSIFNQKSIRSALKEEIYNKMFEIAKEEPKK